MPAIKVFSCFNQGLEGRLIEVEVDILQGLSSFSIVGLGDAAVQEAKERVRSAIKNSGAKYPQTKKIVNLAPADLKKHGPQFDLPIAVGLLLASGQIPGEQLKDCLIVGELALNGSVRAVNGILTMTIFAKKNGWKRIIIPEHNWHESALVEGIEIIAVNNLREVIEQEWHTADQSRLPVVTPAATTPQVAHPPADSLNTGLQSPETAINSNYPDFADIFGLEEAKRALCIAAAGGHHTLLAGPPGVGKTMLAKAMPGISPELTNNEFFELMQIYSCAGLFHVDGSSTKAQMRRPFRQVHPTASLISLTGGGAALTPGEISLAHNGTLFLDEIAEFPRSHLEALRQPLEERAIYLGRASGTIKYPANFTLIAGMNPCPCGYFGDPQKECSCQPYQIIRYQKKLSGPLIDRIDLVINVPRQPLAKFRSLQGQHGQKYPETSVQFRQKIQAAQKLQFIRGAPNSQLSPQQLKKYCSLDLKSQEFLFEAAEKLMLSGRGFHRLLKVARTIADLENADHINTAHLSEALQFRFRGFGN